MGPDSVPHRIPPWHTYSTPNLIYMCVGGVARAGDACRVPGRPGAVAGARHRNGWGRLRRVRPRAVRRARSRVEAVDGRLREVEALERAVSQYARARLVENEIAARASRSAGVARRGVPRRLRGRSGDAARRVPPPRGVARR